MNLRLFCAGLVCCLLISPFSVTDGFSQATQVTFEDPAWDLSHASESRVEDYKGRKSLFLKGKAFIDQINIADGVVEVDVTTPNPRAFAGILFRTQSPTEYEEMYIRLHKSGSPDAIQYTPVFKNVAAWQLYGPGYGWGTAAFDRNEWIPLRIEFSGQEVKIFAGQANNAVLLSRLRRDEQSGGLGVWSLFGAYFSNFRYSEKSASKNNLEEPAPEQGVITDWNLSNAFWAHDVNLTERPSAANTNWHTVNSEPTGLINLSRYLPENELRELPDDGDFDAGQAAVGAFAKTVITSESDQIKKLHFGYSDNVVILLNGRPIYTGKSGFRARDPLFQGMIGYHDAVFLDLNQGENELIFAVSEVFGGWGFMAKFENPDGIDF